MSVLPFRFFTVRTRNHTATLGAHIAVVLTKTDVFQNAAVLLRPGYSVRASELSSSVRRSADIETV